MSRIDISLDNKELYAGGRSRTDTGIAPHQILSLARLPVSSRRRDLPRLVRIPVPCQETLAL